MSANPLAMPELCRLGRQSHLRVKQGYLQLGLGANIQGIRVPRASVYVLDAFSTGPMTEVVLAAIRTRIPRARVIVAIDGLPDAQAFALLALGVRGIVRLKELDAHLGKAIVHVADGGVWMPRGLMAKYLDADISRAPARLVSGRRLSAREKQVLERVLKNQSNKEIGSELHISESTVKFHLARLFEKFGVRRRADLILQSVQESAALVH